MTTIVPATAQQLTAAHTCLKDSSSFSVKVGPYHLYQMEGRDDPDTISWSDESRGKDQTRYTTIYKSYNLPGAVALSADMSTVYFQRFNRPFARNRKVYLTRRSCPLNKSSLRYFFSRPHKMVRLPTTASAMAAHPQQAGTLALVCDKDVYEFSAASGLRQVTSLPEAANQIAYMPDGSLAVRGSSSRYWMVSAASKEAKELSAAELDVEGYTSTVSSSCAALGCPPDATLEQVREFRASNPWRFNTDLKLRPCTQVAAADGRRIAFLMDGEHGTELTVWNRENREVQTLHTFADTKAERLALMWSPDGNHLAAWRPSTVGADQKQATDVLIWDLPDGHLHVLPGAMDLVAQATTGRLNFSLPGTSTRREIGLDEMQAVENEHWHHVHFEQFLLRGAAAVLGTEMPRPRGQVVAADGCLVLGKVRVARRGETLPQVASPPPVEKAEPAPQDSLGMLLADVAAARQHLQEMQAQTADADASLTQARTRLEEYLLQQGYSAKG